MTRTSLFQLAALAVGLAAGCKGETKTVQDPNTVAALKTCEESKASKETLITSLTEDKANCLRDKGAPTGNEVVISIEGTLLTIKPSPPGTEPKLNPKIAKQVSGQFLDVVAKSRGAIQKCYEQALKKDANLQARTITLTVSAVFSQAGAYQDGNFSPTLGGTFDSCIKTVASKWAIPPQSSPATRVKAQVSLTPS